jgi:hypothetical protein
MGQLELEEEMLESQLEELQVLFKKNFAKFYSIIVVSYCQAKFFLIFVPSYV